MQRRGRINRFAALSAALVYLAVLNGPVSGQPSKLLQVAVYDVPPYGIVAPDGTISGVSVDLWRRVAEQIHRQFDLIAVSDMASLLKGVREGRFDVAIGAITITGEREKLVDFSYPAHRSGVAIAMRKQTGPLFVLRAYFHALSELNSLIVFIFIAMGVIGLAMWRVERAQLSKEHESHVATLRDGLYWAAVTMTTVGYGDKTPKTNAGRIVATVWMFASLVLISLLSTSLVSKLTADRLEGAGDVASLDLTRQSLAAAGESSGAEYLDAQRLRYAKAKDLSEALTWLESGRVTAVVNSVGALHYFVTKSTGQNLVTLQGLVAPAYMAFALPPGSELRHPINQALIRITSGREWTQTEERFLNP